MERSVCKGQENIGASVKPREEEPERAGELPIVCKVLFFFLFHFFWGGDRGAAYNLVVFCGQVIMLSVIQMKGISHT